MSLAIVLSRACMGIHAPLVSVEVHLSNGLPGFSIVGLPEATVKESRDRVRSALLNSQYQFPSRKITVNLAPAELPKDGGRFDLPIAIGILAASRQVPLKILQQYEFAGELALSGELREIRGALPLAIGTRNDQRKLIIPWQNAEEVSLAGELQVYPAKRLLEVCQHLSGEFTIIPYQVTALESKDLVYPDLQDVRGQAHAKRALEIAAAGGHSLLMVGPPGTGKSMLAQRLPGILPDLSEDEAIEVASVASVARKGFDWKYWRKRPFRSPHHSASSVALVGGGSPPRPGEISLSHRGVLFLDELPEFDRKVIEALREPLESGTITISRAAMQAEFPAHFQFIAAMNPCPCGYLGDISGKCNCSPEQVRRYRSKISGPILDRIDLHIEVPRLPEGCITMQHSAAESSQEVKKRVIKSRELQLNRSGQCNALLSHQQLIEVALLAKPEQQFVEQVINRLKLSARSYHRILRVARTIADLQKEKTILREHLAEAVSYRKVERSLI